MVTERKPKDGFALAAKIVVGLVVLTIIGILAWNWYSDHIEKVVEQDHRKQLQADSLKLENKVLIETGKRKDAEDKFQSALDKSAVSSANFQSGVDKANKRTDKEVYALPPKELKERADREVGDIGPVPTTEADIEKNIYYARLKDRNKTLEDSIPKLHERIGYLETENKDLKEQVSDLETLSNEKDYAISNFRSDNQDKIAKASKGVVRKIFNGGKIRELQNVDKRLSTIQKIKK